MKPLARIDDETISGADFIGYLKLSNQFPHLMERMIRRKLLAHAARRRNLAAGEAEIQRASDDFRRCMGLHRALDARRWLATADLTLDDFEGFITEHVLVTKLVALLTAPENVEAYFHRNRPRFEAVDLAHIVVEGEAAAREIASMVREAPDRFETLARTYSLDADTRDAGGRMTDVRRGSLPAEMEGRVFTAGAGDVLGPFRLNDDVFDIIRVDARKPPVLDDDTRERIAELIQEEWLAEQIREHSVGLLPGAADSACEFIAVGEG